MSAVNLRAKIRELIVSGVLPSVPSLTEQVARAEQNWKTRIVVGGPNPEPCTICGEPDPQVSYSYFAGQVVSVHTACDALWKQERAAQ